MSYRNLIDKALEAAQARAHTPVETAKIASAPDALIKEAMDVAGALEFVSLSATGGDRAAGFREEMIREFYKTASAGNPANGPTAASGTQGIAPAAGKTKIAPKGLVGGNAPAQSTVSAATKDGDKAMLESFKQAGGQSLYDILMGNKTAAAGGPAEHDSETLAGVGSSNENSTYRKTLHSNEGPVNANRRDLKKSTRARLAEAFAHTGDTLGDATAAQIFPQAAARGSLKIAEDIDPRLAAAVAGGLGSAIPIVPFTGTLASGLAARGVAPQSMSEEEKNRMAMGASTGSLAGGLLGRGAGMVTAGMTGIPQTYFLGKTLGSAGGGALGAHLAMPSKEAGAIGGTLLGGAIGAATADKDERKKGAIRGALAGGTVGAIGKRIRSKQLDKAVGKRDSLSSLLKKSVKINMEEGPNTSKAQSRLQELNDGFMRRHTDRMAAYQGRKLKGATAGAVGATGLAAGMSTRSRNKKSSDE